DPAEAVDGLKLAAAVRHKLHADANAEKRAGTSDRRFVQRCFESGYRGKTASAIGEGADAGQDDPIGAHDRFRLIGNLDLGGNPSGGGLEGLRCRAQITRTGVDDRYLHNRLPPRTPLVEGTAPARRASISTA